MVAIREQVPECVLSALETQGLQNPRFSLGEAGLSITHPLRADLYVPFDRKKEIDLSPHVVPWYMGERKAFNLAVVDFGNGFAECINSTVPLDERIICNTNELIVLAFDSEEIRCDLDELAEVVSLVEEEGREPNGEERFAYQTIVAKIASGIANKRVALGLSREKAGIVPLKGGMYLTESMPDVELEKVTAINCKRIPLSIGEGFFALGMDNSYGEEEWEHSRYLNAAELDGEHIRLMEISLVSGMTTLGVMLFLHNLGIKPGLLEINAIAMSQQAVENVLELAKQLDWSVCLLSGGLFYKVGDFFTEPGDKVMTDDGRHIVGTAHAFFKNKVA